MRTLELVCFTTASAPTAIALDPPKRHVITYLQLRSVGEESFFAVVTDATLTKICGVLQVDPLKPLVEPYPVLKLVGTSQAQGDSTLVLHLELPNGDKFDAVCAPAAKSRFEQPETVGP